MNFKVKACTDKLDSYKTIMFIENEIRKTVDVSLFNTKPMLVDAKLSK